MQQKVRKPHLLGIHFCVAYCKAAPSTGANGVMCSDIYAICELLSLDKFSACYNCAREIGYGNTFWQ
jgi:hypothetical protein